MVYEIIILTRIHNLLKSYYNYFYCINTPIKIYMSKSTNCAKALIIPNFY